MLERKIFLSESMRKHIDKQKMKGWQRRSKFATLIKKREEKQKNLKKAFTWTVAGFVWTHGGTVCHLWKKEVKEAKNDNARVGNWKCVSDDI